MSRNVRFFILAMLFLLLGAIFYAYQLPAQTAKPAPLAKMRILTMSSTSLVVALDCEDGYWPATESFERDLQLKQLKTKEAVFQKLQTVRCRKATTAERQIQNEGRAKGEDGYQFIYREIK